MTDIRQEVTSRITVLVGLEVTGIHRAADMLTLQFGPLTPIVNRNGAIKHVGKWALHIQCPWKIEVAGNVLSTQSGLQGSEEQADLTIEKICELVLAKGPYSVERVRASKSGGARLSLSRELSIVLEPLPVPEEEDWRLFAPGSDEHFVIEGGKIAS
jgi:hypothetical protein